jgi:putative hydrolase of the HAD superfamily
MIRCVISDLGKVVVSFDNSIFFAKMAECCPYSKEDVDNLTTTHFYLIELFDKGELTPHEFYRRVIETFKADIEYEKFFSIYNDVFSLNPEVLNILKKLKGRYRLVLLSNTDIMRYGFIQKRFPEILIFDDYVLSYEVGAMKPDPQIYRVALKRARAKPEECVFIDDIKENVDAAIGLGIRGIIMEPQTDLRAALKEFGLTF